jgi:hypothetical protein
LIYYIKINVEKSVKLDEWKNVLYSCNPYIAGSIETTFLRKNIYGLGKRYLTETNCMQRSAPRQAGFSFVLRPVLSITRLSGPPGPAAAGLPISLGINTYYQYFANIY